MDMLLNHMLDKLNAALQRGSRLVELAELPQTFSVARRRSRNNDFVPDGGFPLPAMVHVGVAQAFSKRGPGQVRVAGEVKRGRCASRYLARAARKNARNLTVACMHRAPTSYFARACVLTLRWMTRHTFSANREHPQAMKNTVVMEVAAPSVSLFVISFAVFPPPLCLWW